MIHTNKIPISIITGFLGAGKTTFLQNILTKYHGKKIAIIQNEFGDTSGLEYAMVMEKNQGEEIEYIEFLNGCVCCSSKKGLTLAIEKIIQKKYFDNIFIETSGLADPAPIISSLWLDNELGSDFYLNGTITITDAKNIDKYVQNYDFNKQLVVADCIIINKIDLVDGDQCILLKNLVSKMNCLAKIVLASYSHVDLDLVLDIQAYSIPQEEILSQIDRFENSLPQVNLAKSGFEPNLSCKHDDDIRSVSIAIEADVISKNHFEKIIGSLLWNDDSSQIIMRIKGIIAIKNKNKKYAVQAVYDLFEVKSMNIQWKENEPRLCKIIFIGKKLDEIMLHDHVQKTITCEI
jgi:G3E family GTPase